MLLKAVVIYFIIINIIGYVIMGIDKRKSLKDKWRVKEKSLFTIAFIGGASGMLLGMRNFHHKTKKPMFKVGIPMLTILNMVVYIFIIYKIRS